MNELELGKKVFYPSYINKQKKLYPRPHGPRVISHFPTGLNQKKKCCQMILFLIIMTLRGQK